MEKFGRAVAVSGNLVVVSAEYRIPDNRRDDPWNEWEQSLGAVDVFRTTDGGLTFEKSHMRYRHITQSRVNDYGSTFGWSVAISGNILLVGDCKRKAVIVFRTNDGGRSFRKTGRLSAPKCRPWRIHENLQVVKDWFGTISEFLAT